MLRYKTKTRPGLVTLYDIRPRNGVGLFLQPRSPHRANVPHMQSMVVSPSDSNPDVTLSRLMPKSSDFFCGFPLNI